MFAVVEFFGTDEENSTNEIAVVPLCWIHKSDRKCYWPQKIPAKVKFADFVRNSTLPKTSWPSYKIYKVHSRKETYDLAESELSDLLKDNRSEMEDSSSTVKSLSRKMCNTIGDSDLTRINNTYTSSATQRSDSTGSLPSTITISSASNTTHTNCSTQFENQMIDKISKIETYVEQHTTILNDLARFIRGTNTKLIQKPEEAPDFPMKELAAFQQFDASLKQNDNLSQYMVTRMASVGGVEIDATTRCIMRFLLSDEVAKHYNWKGRDKLSFEKTNIMPLIHDAVRRTYTSHDGTDFIVNKTVKDWLKYATSRLNLKKSRQTSN